MQPPPSPYYNIWSPHRQIRLEDALARLTVSANLPLRWVENPELQALFTEFLPSARLISRKQLVSTIIPRVLKRKRAEAQETVQGQESTVQGDGWSAADKHHYQGFFLAVRGRDFPARLVDTSAERKTAQELLKHVRAILDHVESEAAWRSRVAAFVSDNGGESKAVRRLIRLERQSLIVLPCYAHQINLIVGDYFKKCGPIFSDISACADQLITWLRSKTFVLGKLREIQEELHQSPLSVIRAAITRWIAHYLAYRRLLDLRDILRMMVIQDRGKEKSDLLSGKADAVAKTRDMIAIIEDSTFWQALVRYV